MHQLADFITGRQAELNMANAREIGQEDADAIHTPKLVEEQNGEAMGADELLDADVALASGELAAVSDVVSEGVEEANVVDHAASSLDNDEMRLKAATGAP